MLPKRMLNLSMFVVPLLILAGTATYAGVTLYKQQQQLNDIALAADRYKPVVINKDDLAQQFDAYIRASGLSVGAPQENQQNVGFSTGHKKENAYAPSTSSERIYGNPDAQFYVIEYSDFECPYCKQHFPQMVDLVDSSSGNIALVFKHVPAHGEASRTESLAAECAAEQGGNPSFFRMAKAIFKNTLSDGRGLSTPIDELAEQNGLNGKRLLDCINSARPSGKIAADVREASSLGIEQTPTNIVVYQDKSAMVQGAVSGTGLMSMMAQLSAGGK